MYEFDIMQTWHVLLATLYLVPPSVCYFRFRDYLTTTTQSIDGFMSTKEAPEDDFTGIDITPPGTFTFFKSITWCVFDRHSCSNIRFVVGRFRQVGIG